MASSAASSGLIYPTWRATPGSRTTLCFCQGDRGPVRLLRAVARLCWHRSLSSAGAMLPALRMLSCGGLYRDQPPIGLVALLKPDGCAPERGIQRPVAPSAPRHGGRPARGGGFSADFGLKRAHCIPIRSPRHFLCSLSLIRQGGEAALGRPHFLNNFLQETFFGL